MQSPIAPGALAAATGDDGACRGEKHRKPVVLRSRIPVLGTSGSVRTRRGSPFLASRLRVQPLPPCGVPRLLSSALWGGLWRAV